MRIWHFDFPTKPVTSRDLKLVHEMLKQTPILCKVSNDEGLVELPNLCETDLESFSLDDVIQEVKLSLMSDVIDLFYSTLSSVVILAIDCSITSIQKSLL